MASPKYPKIKSGKKRKFDALRLRKYISFCLREISFNVFRILTKFILYSGIIVISFTLRHSRKNLGQLVLDKRRWPWVLLNATIDQFSKYIFIGTEVLEIITGSPRFDSSKVLHLDTSDARTESFLILRRKIKSTLSLSLDLELSKNAIFNFVFNYLDDSNFKMLRLDNRNKTRSPNTLLYSQQKDDWYFVAKAAQVQPPEGIIILKIEIDIKNSRFSFRVNGDDYKFYKDSNKEVNLFQEFREGLRVGWFNELYPVKLSNIKIS